MGLFRDVSRRVGKTRAWAAVFKHIAPPVDRFVHRLTGGRRTVAQLFLPTLILVHRGARSGKEYRTPLCYVDLDGGFALAATNWGQAHHPGWSSNLIADPDVTVEVGGRKIRVRARRLDEATKAELWPRFVEMWPAYGEYVKRSGRNIRVFVLEPVSG